MSEESVSYGKEPKYKIGEKVKFIQWGKLVDGEIVKYEPNSYYGLNYTIKDDINGSLHALSENDINPTPISPPYEVSYIADKPKASLEGQVGGEHYKNLAIQPVEYCYYNNIPGIESSIIRYATRHRDKNKALDVEKIIHYAKILLQLEYDYTDEQINEL